jgi:hypothetical protein
MPNIHRRAAKSCRPRPGREPGSRAKPAPSRERSLRGSPYGYESIAPVLIVERVQPTRDFFRDRLGFAQTAVVADGDELGFAMLEKDGVVVMVQSHRSVIDDVGPDAAHAINTTISARGAVGLFLTVSDVELLVPRPLPTRT